MIQVGVYESRQYDRDSLGRLSEGQNITWHFHEFGLSADTAVTAAGLQTACVFVNDRVDRPCLEQLHQQQVRHIALRCMGFNNVDIACAKSLGVAVTRVPAYSPYSVAEHTVALLMALNRKVHRAYNRVRELNFSLNGLVGRDLYGKTAGLLGTGKIGRIVGQILRGFGMRVLAYDPYPAAEWASAHGVEYVDLPALARQSHIISLHMPLTRDTHHIIDDGFLSQMQRGAYLINVSRGKLIDTRAMIAALKSGQLGGVALDVYEEEEGVFFQDLSGEMLRDDILARLLTFPNVLITAHQAFLTQEALTDIGTVTVENILRCARGEPFLDGTQL